MPEHLDSLRYYYIDLSFLAELQFHMQWGYVHTRLFRPEALSR